jgi:hypothetical protein
VVTKDDFPYGLNGNTIVPPASSDIAENLFSGYGFEQYSFNGIYNATNSLPVSTYQFISGNFYIRIETTNANAFNYYSFSKVGTATIPNNPRNILKFVSTSNSTGDTIKRLGCVIGGYQDYQSSQLGLSMYLQKVLGSFTDLQVVLMRESQTAIQEINLGNIPITTILENQTLFVTVPPIDNVTYLNDDQLRLEFLLPLNQDLEIDFTATWLQESIDKKFFIHHGNSGKHKSSRYFQAERNTEKENFNEVVGGFPAILGNGGLDYSYDVGKIEQLVVPSITSPEYAAMLKNRVRMDGKTEFLKDQVYNNTLTNRFIQATKQNGYLRYSPYTFNAVAQANVLTVSTGLATTHLRPSSVNAGGRITQNVVSDSFTMGVKANINPLRTPEYDLLEFQWLNNGAVTSGMFTPSFPGRSFDYFAGTTPVLANYLGEVIEVVNGPTSLMHYYPNNEFGLTTQGTPTTPAVVYLSFNHSSAVLNPYLLNLASNERGSPSNLGYLAGNNPFALHLKYRVTSNDIPTPSYNFPLGYLAWQDPATSNSPITAATPDGVYKYILSFELNGLTPTPPTTAGGGVSRIVTNILSIHSNYQRLLKTALTINNPRSVQYTIVSMPQTGDTILTDNGKTKFELIMIVDGASRPAPSSGEVPVYVDILSSDTLDTVAFKIGDTLTSSVAGIPDANWLGMATEPIDGLSITDNFITI